MKVIECNNQTFFEEKFNLAELQINEFQLYGRTYKKVICSESCANLLMKMFPELSVIGVDQRGVHLTQKTDQGYLTSAVSYLKEVYGLDPNDINMQSNDMRADIDIYAEHLGLTKIQDWDFGKARKMFVKMGFQVPIKS